MNEEWLTESNYEEYKGAHGYKCVIKRIDGMLHLCGYVGVTKDHPLYKKSYRDFDIEAHGGVTYADCLLEDGLWYIGFDCGHAGDYIPGSYRNIADEAVSGLYDIFDNTDTGNPDSPTYKNWAYVKEEVRNLEEQVANARR